MKCCCYLRNVQVLSVRWTNSHERRFEEQFNRLIIPFGAKVEYHPVSAEDQARLNQFSKEVLSGIFMGNALYASRSWDGDRLTRSRR